MLKLNLKSNFPFLPSSPTWKWQLIRVPPEDGITKVAVNNFYKTKLCWKAKLVLQSWRHKNTRFHFQLLYSLHRALPARHKAAITLLVRLCIKPRQDSSMVQGQNLQTGRPHLLRVTLLRPPQETGSTPQFRRWGTSGMPRQPILN